MVKQDAVFMAAEAMSPDYAAKLSQQALRYRSDILIECDGKQLRLDSLISILAMEMHRGMKVTVIAEGEDEADAVQGIRKVLEG